MKNPRLDLLVEFDDQMLVDLEMQLRQSQDYLPIRFSYYLARLHGFQQFEGKYYKQLKETIVLVFFNVNLIENDWKAQKEADKKSEEADKKVEDANKHIEESDKEIEKMNQERSLMIHTMLINGMSVSQIAKCLSKSEEEIMKFIL